MITHSRYIKTGYVTTIKEEIIYHGKWWIPSDIEHKVNGILKISPSKGIMLDLFSHIKFGFLEKDLVDYEIINGETREGGLITLNNCFEVNKKRPLGYGEIHQTFRCNTLFWGGNFNNKSELIFNHFQIEFPYNNNFFIDSLFESDVNNNIIKYKDSYKFEIILDGLKIILNNYIDIQEGLNSVNLKKRGKFLVKSEKGISLEEFNNNILFPIQNYFGFLSDTYNWVLDLKASSVSSGDRDYHLIDIVDSYPFQRHSQKEIQSLIKFAKPDPNLFIIPFSNWLRKYPELKIIVDLYSDVIYRAGNSPTVQFLLLIQACEYYHSLRYDSKIIDENKYMGNLKEVLKSVDKKHKSWVNDALRNSNNKTLKLRLTELIENNSTIFKEVLSNIDSIVQKIGDTRNYYTHYNQSIKYKIAIGDELIFLISILFMLVKSIMLKELGFNQENILYALKGQGIHRLVREKSKILGYIKQ